MANIIGNHDELLKELLSQDGIVITLLKSSYYNELIKNNSFKQAFIKRALDERTKIFDALFTETKAVVKQPTRNGCTTYNAVDNVVEFNICSNIINKDFCEDEDFFKDVVTIAKEKPEPLAKALFTVQIRDMLDLHYLLGSQKGLELLSHEEFRCFFADLALENIEKFADTLFLKSTPAEGEDENTPCLSALFTTKEGRALLSDKAFQTLFIEALRHRFVEEGALPVSGPLPPPSDLESVFRIPILAADKYTKISFLACLLSSEEALALLTNKDFQELFIDYAKKLQFNFTEALFAPFITNTGENTNTSCLSRLSNTKEGFTLFSMKSYWYLLITILKNNFDKFAEAVTAHSASDLKPKAEKLNLYLLLHHKEKLLHLLQPLNQEILTDIATKRSTDFKGILFEALTSSHQATIHWKLMRILFQLQPLLYNNIIETVMDAANANPKMYAELFFSKKYDSKNSLTILDFALQTPGGREKILSNAFKSTFIKLARTELKMFAITLFCTKDVNRDLSNLYGIVGTQQGRSWLADNDFKQLIIDAAKEEPVLFARALFSTLINAVGPNENSSCLYCLLTSQEGKTLFSDEPFQKVVISATQAEPEMFKAAFSKMRNLVDLMNDPAIKTLLSKDVFTKANTELDKQNTQTDDKIANEEQTGMSDLPQPMNVTQTFFSSTPTENNNDTSSKKPDKRKRELDEEKRITPLKKNDSQRLKPNNKHPLLKSDEEKEAPTPDTQKTPKPSR